MEAIGATPLKFDELTSAGNQRFHDAIAAAKAASEYGAAVYTYPAEDYKNMRLFVSEDGKSGFALKDNDIVSLFKHPSSTDKKFAYSALALATQEGGQRLDAFDTELPFIYGRNGFRSVARIAWSEPDKPDGWSYSKFATYNNGRPDVVFMVHDPAHAKSYKPGDGTRVADYAAGNAAQVTALDRQLKYWTAYFKQHGLRYCGESLRGGGLDSNQPHDLEYWTAYFKQHGLSYCRKAGFDPNEPRDHGEWTSGGGSGDSGVGSAGEKPSKPGKGKHPGPGYSAGARVINGVIHTSNVYDAQRALFENRKVELKQIKQVSTLIKRLGETAAEMEAQGEKAPVFNLCNVSVKGTNLFCAESKGIPRVEMPVIPAKRTKDFIKHLKDKGYDVEKGIEKAANLRATQSEIDGVKVATQMARIKKDGFYKRLVISRDDYILDGHHTWAGELGLDAKDGDLTNDKNVKIARVDISITKLIEEADAWTKAEGIAKKPAGQKAMPCGCNTVLRQPGHDVSDEPRDHGRWTSGGGGGGGGSAQGELFPELPPLPPAKGNNKIEDFAKDQVVLAGDIRADKEKADKFLQHWNESVREAPAEFKKEFLGGLPATMTLKSNDNGDVWTITGKLQSPDGNAIGEYTRTIDFSENRASSDFFKLYKTGGGTGKQMLAANVAMYQKLGLDEVEVHADIDVGGYAWAKYGYVPSDDSWRSLNHHINNKIDELAGGGGYQPDSWEEIGDHDQDSIFKAWARATENDFYDSELDSWRENGGDLAQAKSNLADVFLPSSPWANNALEGHMITVGEGENEKAVKVSSLIPVDRLLENTSVQFRDRRGDGNEDPEITVDDTLTAELNDDQRAQIESILVEGFNKQAESDAPDVDPPAHIHDNIRDSQRDYWDSMRARDKYKWAAENDELPHQNEGGGEIDQDDASTLRDLADESDPKALWAIADSAHGKNVLLGTDWYGVLDLHDSETMARFNAYVNKK